MMSMVGGKERTLEEFTALGDTTGWKLETVKPNTLTAFVFVPK